VVYFTTHSETRIAGYSDCHRMINEFEVMLRQVVVAYVKVLIRNLSRGTEGNYKKSVRIAGPWAEV
jgi:hypothetical protein